MKKTIVILFMFISISLYSQEWNEEYGMAMFSLTETDPKLVVSGSDVPTIAIYESGDVIYKRIENNQPMYYSVQLNQQEIIMLFLNLGITDDLMGMKSYTKASALENQPTNTLTFMMDSVRTKRVYGNLRMDATVRSKTLPDYLDLYDFLIKYKHDKATEWLPEYIELMVVNNNNSTIESKTWPVGWPTFSSESTIKRGDNFYSIYLPKKHFKELTTLLDNEEAHQAIEIEGEKYFVTYRFPFPNL